jgi:hypothetical protein
MAMPQLAVLRCTPDISALKGGDPFIPARALGDAKGCLSKFDRNSDLQHDAAIRETTNHSKKGWL